MKNRIVLVTVLAILFGIGLTTGLYLFDTIRFVENLPQPPSTAEEPSNTGTSSEEADTDTGIPQTSTPITEEGQDDTDWRVNDGPGHNHSQVSINPWQVMESLHTEGANEATPQSPLWFEIEDLDERAAAYHTQLIKQFGDVPQVHVLAEGWLTLWRGVPMSIDESIRFNEAMNHLYPSESTQKVIQSLKAREASRITGNASAHQHSEQFLNLKHQFPVLESFVKQYGFQQGIRNFSQHYPERAAEFKRALRTTDEVKRVFETGHFTKEIEEFFGDIDVRE